MHLALAAQRAFPHSDMCQVDHPICNCTLQYYRSLTAVQLYTYTHLNFNFHISLFSISPPPGYSPRAYPCMIVHVNTSDHGRLQLYTHTHTTRAILRLRPVCSQIGRSVSS